MSDEVKASTPENAVSAGEARSEARWQTATTVFVSVALSVAAMLLVNRFLPQYNGLKLDQPEVPKIAVIDMVRVASLSVGTNTPKEEVMAKMASVTAYISDLVNDGYLVINQSAIMGAPPAMIIDPEKLLDRTEEALERMKAEPKQTGILELGKKSPEAQKK